MLQHVYCFRLMILKSIYIDRFIYTIRINWISQTTIHPRHLQIH